MDVGDEQMNDTMALLAVALERLGGHLEVTDEELEASKDRYGRPAPLLIARLPNDTLVGHLSTIERMVDEQWPLMAQCLDLDEAQARAASTAVQQQLLAMRAQHEFHKLVDKASEAALAQRAKRRDGLN